MLGVPTKFDAESAEFPANLPKQCCPLFIEPVFASADRFYTAPLRTKQACTLHTSKELRTMPSLRRGIFFGRLEAVLGGSPAAGAALRRVRLLVKVQELRKRVLLQLKLNQVL